MRGHRWVVLLGGKRHRCHFTMCAYCRIVRQPKSPASMKICNAPCRSSWAETA